MRLRGLPRSGVAGAWFYSYGGTLTRFEAFPCTPLNRPSKLRHRTDRSRANPSPLQNEPSHAQLRKQCGQYPYLSLTRIGLLLRDQVHLAELFQSAPKLERVAGPSISQAPGADGLMSLDACCNMNAPPRWARPRTQEDVSGPGSGLASRPSSTAEPMKRRGGRIVAERPFSFSQSLEGVDRNLPHHLVLVGFRDEFKQLDSARCRQLFESICHPLPDNRVWILHVVG